MHKKNNFVANHKYWNCFSFRIVIFFFVVCLNHVQTKYLVRNYNIPKLGHGVVVRACYLIESNRKYKRKWGESWLIWKENEWKNNIELEKSSKIGFLFNSLQHQEIIDRKTSEKGFYYKTFTLNLQNWKLFFDPSEIVRKRLIIL